MKKIIIALGAATAIATLAACSTPATAPAPTVTVTKDAPAPAPAPDIDEPSMSDDEMFLFLLRGEDPTFNSVPDSTLTDLGRTTCEALDAGMTLEMYAAVAANSGITRQEAATIAAASIVVYCPWHEGIAG